MKKGLFATIITSVALALSLFVYMLVVVIDVPQQQKPGDYVPANVTYDISCRTGDILDELNGYSIEDETLSFTFEEGVTEDSQPVKFNELTGNYEVSNVGKVTAVTTEENGDTKTYNFTCYNKGEGTVESPLNICNAEHLVEFQQATIAKNSGVDYLAYNVALVCDIDLEGINWMPIGNNYKPFTGNFDGNGYTIYNMSISVDADNYTDYISLKNPNLSIELGFFGKIANSTVTDVNFKNANILLTSDVLSKIIDKDYVDVAGLSGGVIAQVSIGTLAGMMTRSTYTSTIENTQVKVENTTIQGFSYNGDPNGTRANGIGGVVGVATESEISNIYVNADLFANYQISEGSKVGGIVGFIPAFDTSVQFEEYVALPENKTKINNAIVEVDVTTRYNLTEVEENNHVGDTYNMVGLITPVATNAEIKDVIVKNSLITDPVGKVNLVTDISGEIARISAGVVEAYVLTYYPGPNGLEVSFSAEESEYKTVLQNISVENVVADIAASFGGVVFIADKYTQLIDCTVSGLVAKTLNAAGVAYSVKEGASITYTEASADKTVVDADLRGVKSAGIAIYNNGTISGYKNTANNTTSVVDVNIEGYGADIDIKVENPNNVFAAGLVGYMYSETDGHTATLSDFTVSATMNKSVNYAGAVHMLGQDTKEGLTYYDTLVDNIIVYLSATSYSKGSYSTTRKVGGAVVNMYDNATLKNVNVLVKLNEGVDTTKAYASAIFGGLVAHVQGALIEINTCGVEGNAYMNEGNFWSMKKVGEGNPAHYVQVAGGLIGLMSTEDFNYIMPVAKNISDETAPYTNIYKNEVKNLTIVVDGDFDNGVENTDIFYALRGVGALVGNINNRLKNDEGEGLPDALDLTTNTLTNINISANFKAFTFKVFKADSENYDSYILVGAGGQKAVGTLNEVIDADSLHHTIPYVNLPERVDGDYTYNDTTPEEVA